MGTALAEQARAMGLEACAEALDGFAGLPAAAAADPALAQPPADDAKTALAQMVRRGLEPRLVELLRDALASLPLERGLLAWDVLNRSFVAPGPVRERLVEAARAVLPLVAAGGQFVTIRSDVPELASHGRGPRAALVMAALDPTIDASDASPKALERARQFARILHRSHLSTLASFQLAELVYRHRYHRALPDLVEVLLDADARDVDALLEPLGDPEPTAEPSTIELRAYARARTSLNAGKPSECLEFAEKNRLTFEVARLQPAKAAAVNPRPTLAYADAALRKHLPTIPLAHVAAIAQLEPDWRYAFQVATTYAAATTRSREFLATFGNVLQSFGNDYRTWLAVARAMPADAQWASGLLAMLVREAQTLPHESAPWKAAAMILGGAAAKQAREECEARLRQQVTIR